MLIFLEYCEYKIPVGVYKNPPEYDIEGDASSATYPLALAAVTGGTVTVSNIGSSSIQGKAVDTVLPKK